MSNLKPVQMGVIDEMVTEAILLGLPYPCDQDYIEENGLTDEMASDIMDQVQNLENLGWIDEDWMLDGDEDIIYGGIIVCDYMFLDACGNTMNSDRLVIQFNEINRLKKARGQTGGASSASSAVSDYDRAMGILQ